MIIQTRYRDIPFEEAKKCQPKLQASAWDSLRGKAVTIEVPPQNMAGLQEQLGICSQQIYKTADGKPVGYARARWVCAHIAEIGD